MHHSNVYPSIRSHLYHRLYLTVVFSSTHMERTLVRGAWKYMTISLTPRPSRRQIILWKHDIGWRWTNKIVGSYQPEDEITGYWNPWGLCIEDLPRAHAKTCSHALPWGSGPLGSYSTEILGKPNCRPSPCLHGPGIGLVWFWRPKIAFTTHSSSYNI